MDQKPAQPGHLTPEMIEELYQFKLTDRMRFLLDTPSALLDHLDGQQQYLLKMALAPIPCPACKAILCQVTGQIGEFDPDGRKQVSDDAYACPFCLTGLTWGLMLTGQQFFTIRDLSTRRDPRA